MSLVALRQLSSSSNPFIRKGLAKQLSCALLLPKKCNHTTSIRPAATATTTATSILEPANDNDDFLRTIFDNQAVWKHQQHLHDNHNSHSTVRLYENAIFSDTYSIRSAAQHAIQRAQIIVERICNAPQNGPQEMAKTIKNLDRLSDTLCSVIDLAEFIRNAHPDKIMMTAANETYGDLCSYMNTLNTDVRLHQVLSQVLTDKSIVSQFTPDEHAAAIVFLKDFEKSGIHLPDKQRQEFVRLSDTIIHLGRDFIQANPRSIRKVKIQLSSLAGLSPSITRSLHSTKDGFVYIPTDSHECQMVLKYAQDPNVRRQIYESINSATQESIVTLERLLSARAELANLVGIGSYAELQLQDKMAKHPKNVNAFLQTLLKHQDPAFKRDLEILQKLKQQEQRTQSFSTVNAWDRDYYMQIYNSTQSRPLTNSTTATITTAPFFSVGSVMQGLSRLFKSLYGVELQHAPLKKNESWHESVRKLNVVCESEGKLGTIYCDLFSRPGKITHAAHYTIRTSRRVDDDDAENDIKFAFPGQDTTDAANRLPPPALHAEPIRGKQGLYQLPAIVLTCDFNSHNQPVAMLSMFDIDTLFHEMGHAMHSMLGRTDFHNVAGTRCASDFVEFPSILMEHFAWHPQVLPLFESNTTQSNGRKQQHVSPEYVLQQRKRFSGIEINSQILMACVDQAYHSEKVNNSDFSSVAEWYKVQDQAGLFPNVPGAMWPVQFGHLFGYGSNYYSYLFDRTLARRVWETNFKANPLDREKGQALRDKMLKWGGARDPWQCVADVLGGEDGSKVVKGDEEAMRTVGDWGIEV